MKLQTKSIATQIKNSCGIVNYTINGEGSKGQYTKQVDKELLRDITDIIVTGCWLQLRMGLSSRVSSEITENMIIFRNL